MVKAYVCKAAEWVTREAMQIHGGMGYAEEFPVSRLFVDARVLSIFEGADETLCLKVIARQLTAASDRLSPVTPADSVGDGHLLPGGAAGDALRVGRRRRSAGSTVDVGVPPCATDAPSAKRAETT